jgi:hypothetical protein
MENELEIPDGENTKKIRTISELCLFRIKKVAEDNSFLMYRVS